MVGGGFVGVCRGAGRKEEVKQEPWQEEGMYEASRL